MVGADPATKDKHSLPGVELLAVVEGHNTFAWEAYVRLCQRPGNLAFFTIQACDWPGDGSDRGHRTAMIVCFRGMHNLDEPAQDNLELRRRSSE
jgi:hypothetical protein